jgi:hypothetical protein
LEHKTGFEDSVHGIFAIGSVFDIPTTDDPSASWRDNIKNTWQSNVNLIGIDQAIDDYDNLQNYLAASSTRVGFIERSITPPVTIPNAVTNTYYVPIQEAQFSLDPDDPTYWGYWAEDWWTEEYGGMPLIPSPGYMPPLASQVWIAGPQTPISVIDNLINNPSTPIYNYAGNVIGGVGSDPILLGVTGYTNSINININFAAQSATAVIDFTTQRGTVWNANFSTNTNLFDRANGYRYTINGASGNVKINNSDTSREQINGINSRLQGHFYGDEANFTGGRFQLDGGNYKTAVGVFKARRVQD